MISWGCPTNRGRKGTLDGEKKSARAKAWVPDADAPAKLKVQFFWPFRGDYWIIELDPEYRYAVVGHPSRDYLWILARTPTLDSELYESLLARIAARGFDVERLNVTPQPKTPDSASPRTKADRGEHG